VLGPLEVELDGVRFMPVDQGADVDVADGSTAEAATVLDLLDHALGDLLREVSGVELGHGAEGRVPALV